MICLFLYVESVRDAILIFQNRAYSLDEESDFEIQSWTNSGVQGPKIARGGGGCSLFVKVGNIGGKQRKKEKEKKDI